MPLARSQLCQICEKIETYNGRGICGRCLYGQYVAHCQFAVVNRSSSQEDGHAERVERYRKRFENCGRVFE